jgi:hypothetical protein
VSHVSEGRVGAQGRAAAAAHDEGTYRPAHSRTWPEVEVEVQIRCTCRWEEAVRLAGEGHALVGPQAGLESLIHGSETEGTKDSRGRQR